MQKVESAPESTTTICAGKTCVSWTDERAFGHRSRHLPATLKDVIAEEAPATIATPRTMDLTIGNLEKLKRKTDEYFTRLSEQNRHQGLAMNMLADVSNSINEIITQLQSDVE